MTLAPFFSRQRRGGGQAGTAPVYRWDPRREMDDLNRFGQLMQTFLGEAAVPGAGWAPPIDVVETDDAYIVDADLPNVDPKEITLEMRGEELRISGMFRQQERGGIMRRQNRQQGEFEYVIDLPSDIDGDRVEAGYDNGVLTVRVAKGRDAQPRRIEIQAQSGKMGQTGQPGKMSQTGQTGQPGQPAQPGQMGQAQTQRGAQENRPRGA